VVGAGIIGLPGAFNEGGFTPSIILSFVVALLSNWSIRLLATLGNAHGASTYEDLWCASEDL
jgi:amino acid permease